MDRLVHERQRVVGGVEVAHAVMDVDGFDRVAGEEVDAVERLSEPQQVLIVLAIADPSPTVEVRDVGRRADRAERHPGATEPKVALRVSGVERELGRDGPDDLLDHRRVEPDTLAAGLDLGAGALQVLARVRIEEVHPRLGKDAQRRAVDRVELVVGDRPGRLVRHPRLAERPLLGQPRPLVRGTPARAAAPDEGLARRRVEVGHVRSIQVVLSWV